MAETVRDLVVSLSLNSDNFAKNIKAINAQMQAAESEFKAAGAGVTGFEKTVAGAQAKVDLLTKKLELQKTAVNNYRKALDSAKSRLSANVDQHKKLSEQLDEAKARQVELTAAYGEGSEEAKQAAKEVKELEGKLASVARAIQTSQTAVSKAEKELNNARAELTRTETELKSANSALTENASAWKKAGDALTGFSDKANKLGTRLSGTGKTLSTYVTAPLAALGAASVAAFNEVDEGMDAIVRLTGASGKALEGYQSVFEKVYGSLNVSAADAANAVGEAATRFGLTGDALGEMSQTFLKFAEITGADVTGAIDDADRILDKFGLDAGSAADMLGMIAKAGQDTGISVTSLMGTLDSSGATLKNMGFSLEESIMLLAQFEANGVDAATALNGMRVAAVNAGKTGGQAAFGEIVKQIKSARTEAQALEIAIETFGSKGGPEMAQAIREGRVSVDGLKVSMNGMAGVVERTFEATQDMTDKTAATLNRLKVAGANLAENLFETLAPVLEELMEHLSGLLDRFAAMDPEMQKSIIKWLGIAAAAGPAVSILGKVAGAAGTVTGALGKFGSAVAAAGGGLKGLGSVLAGSPALWIALAAGVAQALWKLNDVISGAKAAREALERLNAAANEWAGAQADTFYNTSKGLQAFGASTSEFAKSYKGTVTWVSRLTKEWRDTEVESDETVQAYVDEFRTVTAATRDALTELRETAQGASQGALAREMGADITALDEIDARVEELLKKRQESFLTAEDIKELNSLVDRRHNIEVRWHLADEDEDSGFEKITKGVEAARARAKAAGQEVGAEVYEDAMKAAAQGFSALNESIDAEYDKRYELMKLIDDTAQREKAEAELNAWYNRERVQAAKEYAQTLGMTADEEGRSLAAAMLSRESVTDTYAELTELFNLMADGTFTTEKLNQMNAVFEKMSEGELVELIALTEQLNSLKASGLDADTIAETLGLDASQMQMLEYVNKQLAGIQQYLNSYSTTTDLDPLRKMFGGQLSDEVLTIATDLNLEGAYSRWKEFADDPGSVVQTDAEINKYGEKEGGADKSAISNPDAGTAQVDGYGKSKDFSGEFESPSGLKAIVTAYEEDPEFDKYFADPSGLKALVDAYMEDPDGFTASFDGPSGLMALVKAYAKDPALFNSYFASPAGLKALVTAYAEDPSGFSDYFADPVGLKALVEAYMKDPDGFSAAFASPDGLKALVDAYAEDPKGFSKAFADPSGLKALVEAYAEDPEGFSAYFADPSGLQALVTEYAQDPEKFSASFDGPAGLKALIQEYAKDPWKFNGYFAAPGGLSALVKAYAEDPESFDAAFAEPDGLIALVKAYAEDPDFDSQFTPPTGLIALVKAYAEILGGANTDELRPTATVALSDLEKSAVEQWKLRKANTITLKGTVQANRLSVTFGDDWQTELEEKYEEGLLKLYDGKTGLPVAVTPEVLQGLDPKKDIIAGVDENGVYHLLIMPEWLSGDAGAVNATVGKARTAGSTGQAAALVAEARSRWNGSIGGAITDFFSAIPYKMSPSDVARMKKGALSVIQAYEAGLDLSGVEGIDEFVDALQGMIAIGNAFGTDSAIKDELGFDVNFVNDILSELASAGIYYEADELYNLLEEILSRAGADRDRLERESIYAEAKAAAAKAAADKAEREAAEAEARREAASQEWAEQSGVYGLDEDERAEANARNLEKALDVYRDYLERMKGLNGDYEQVYADMSAWFGEGWDWTYLGFPKISEFARQYQEYKAILEAGETELTDAQKTFMEDFDLLVSSMGMSGYVDTESGEWRDLGELLGHEIAAGIDVGQSAYGWDESAQATANSILDALETAMDAHSPARKYIPVGENIAAGVAEGIKSGTGKVTEAITALAAAAVAAAKEALEIASPSRVFRDEVGAMAMRGFGEGVISQTAQQALIIRNAARYLTDSAQGAAVVPPASVSNYNYADTVQITGNSFNIRDEQDIDALAREIAQYTRRQRFGRGGK